MNQFATVVHHTVKDDDNPNFIEDNAPFSVQNIKEAYLGYGYYFWDNHIELAHHWGEIHYNNLYVVCEGTLTVNEDLFFDLVGNRQAQIFISECISEMPALKNLTLGEIIEFLKKLETNPNKKGIFPFKVIRAVDVTEATTYHMETVKFAPNRQGIMTTNPQIIICLIEKNTVFLPSLKIVYPTKYI